MSAGQMVFGQKTRRQVRIQYLKVEQGFFEPQPFIKDTPLPKLFSIKTVFIPFFEI
jgi:hypothetical protein